MWNGKATAILTVVTLAGSFFVSKSEDNNSVVQLVEAVGKNPTASAVDTATTKRHTDSIYAIDLVNFISAIGEASTDDISSDSTNKQTYSVLDYLSGICDGTDFYESGNWEPKTKSPKYVLHIGALPDFDKSKLRRPVKGKINSQFGIRPETGKMHLGLDFKGHKGDTVRAALPGRVIRTSYDRNGYGWYVCLLDSNKIETRYAHLAKVLVKKGDTVGCNMPVGLIGTTGNSTGPHLHFEVRYDGKVVDPEMFLP